MSDAEAMQQQQQGGMPQDMGGQGPMQGGEDDGVHKVFVKGAGIGTAVDKSAIEQAFQRYGEVKSVWISGRDRGFCFVQMARREDADAAAAGMNNQQINGVTVTAEIARRTAPGGRREFGGPSGTKPGDWICPSCNHNNFARRDRCQRCDQPRPYGGGAGGYDDRRRQRGRSRDRDYRRGYDERYDDRRAPEAYDRRGGYDDRRGGYEDRRGGYDDRRGGYDDRRAPMPAYDERRAPARAYEERAPRGRSQSRS